MLQTFPVFPRGHRGSFGVVTFNDLVSATAGARISVFGRVIALISDASNPSNGFVVSRCSLYVGSPYASRYAVFA
jgi:hypothetical protein